VGSTSESAIATVRAAPNNPNHRRFPLFADSIVSQTKMPLMDCADEKGPKVTALALVTVPELVGVPAAPHAIVCLA